MLCGKPMIAWSVEQAKASGVFDHIVISTDSDQIAEAARQAGGEVFFRRSAELSEDKAAKLPVFHDALMRSEEHFGTRFEYYVDLDATSPLRLPSDIVGAMDLFMSGAWDNLITGMHARRSPYFNLVEDVGGNRVEIAKKTAVPIVRRQDAPVCYDMNASIYIWTRESLLECTDVLGPNTGIYVMPEERSIDVDSELDFNFVEYVMSRRLSETA
jgi:CMP-N,N'-diacetyllegionaminic acid synthase